MSEHEATEATERAAAQRDADVIAARLEGSFLSWRMLPQMFIPVVGIPFQVMYVVVLRDEPRHVVALLCGIALMALSLRMHARSFRRRRTAAAAAVRGEPYDRTGFYGPYLAWLVSMIGLMGPFYFLS